MHGTVHPGRFNNLKIINQFTNYQAKMEYEIDQLKVNILFLINHFTNSEFF